MLMKKNVQYLWLCLFSCFSLASLAQERVYTVGVANFQANLSMAAQLNPILKWVGERAGVELVMKSGYNFDDMQRHLARGEYDFYIGFPALQPDIRKGLAYRVLAASAGTAQSAIIVSEQSPYRQLSDLNGQPVAMGSHGIFIANVVPMSALLGAGVKVQPVMVGNQESLITEFKLGKFQAIAVNLMGFKRQIGQDNYPHRVLWQSQPIMNYPLLVRYQVVPEGVAQRVQRAFVDMATDPEGKEVLARVNARPGVRWSGWVAATDQDYEFAIKSYQLIQPISGGVHEPIK